MSEPLTPQDLDAVARGLRRATQGREPVPPPREQYPRFTLDDAYSVQLLQQEWDLAAGARLIGHKVGLTSLAMQRQLGVDSPDFGYIVDDATRIGGDGSVFDAGVFLAPKVEPEFAFVLGEDLSGPGVTLEQASAAIATVHPALEIIDSRVRDWDITLVDTVADNASYGGIAWGSDPLPLSVEDLASVSCSLLVDDVPRGSGVGTDVMGHPVAPLQWLANTLGERGVTLRAGQVILPGSFCAAVPVEAGNTVRVVLAGQGRLTISFR